MGSILGGPVDVLYLFLGLGGLLAGAEMAVGGSLGLAKRWGWPSWVAGVILLALGTSLPEFFVALASAAEYPGLALGTVFGSNATPSMTHVRRAPPGSPQRVISGLDSDGSAPGTTPIRTAGTTSLTEMRSWS